MSHPQQDLRDRTKAFAIRIVRLYRSLPYRTDTQVLGKQLIRLRNSRRCELPGCRSGQVEGRMGRENRHCCRRGRRNSVLARDALRVRNRTAFENRVDTGRSPGTDRNLHGIAQNCPIQCVTKLQNSPITKLQNVVTPCPSSIPPADTASPAR